MHLDAGVQSAGVRNFYQRFKHFQYHEASGPGRPSASSGCSAVSGCGQSYTQEQILELLVLEQFLTILPEEFQTWVKHHPETERGGCGRGRENIQRELEERQQQVSEGGGLRTVRKEAEGSGAAEQGEVLSALVLHSYSFVLLGLGPLWRFPATPAKKQYPCVNLEKRSLRFCLF